MFNKSVVNSQSSAAISFNKVKNAANNITAATTDSSVISVFEHQRLTIQDFVYPTDFNWLLAQELDVFSIKRQRGHWQLKVGHYIGIIILPSNMILEILPKPIASAQSLSLASSAELLLTRQWLQGMLNDLINNKAGTLPHTKHVGQISHHLTPYSSSTLPLSQWLIKQFLQRLALYQPMQHYQTQVHNQPTLQGKLLIKEQLRCNSTQPHKFMSEISVLTKDMLSNRLIKSALLLIQPLLLGLLSNLLSWRQISALNQYEIRKLDLIYAQAKHQLKRQPLTRQQRQAAQHLLDLAYWLLQMQSSSIKTGSSLDPQHPSTHNDSQPRLCLLINMNQAFEQWASQRIATIFTQLDTGYQPLYQPRQVWLSDAVGQACLSIQPDLLIYRTTVDDANAEQTDFEQHGSEHISVNETMTSSKRTCSHIIDIKWKHLSQARDISASDAYQLLSYAHAYQAQQVWLVYPVTDDRRQPVALKQQTAAEDLSYAELWLMPFNVMTGTLNSLPPKDNIVDNK